MLLLFSIRVDEYLTVWKRAVYLGYRDCLCERLITCLCAFFSFGYESGTWSLIILIPYHCLFTLLP